MSTDKQQQQNNLFKNGLYPRILQDINANKSIVWGYIKSYNTKSSSAFIKLDPYRRLFGLINLVQLKFI